MGYSGSGGLTAPVSRSDLAQENLAVYPITMDRWRDGGGAGMNIQDRLFPADWGQTGSFGCKDGMGDSAQPILDTDFGVSGIPHFYAITQFALPPEYVAGQTIQFRARSKMAIAGVWEMDLECWQRQGYGVTPDDIVTTIAKSLTTSFVYYIFDIDPTGLVPGDNLGLRLYHTRTSGGNITYVDQTDLLLDIRG